MADHRPTSDHDPESFARLKAILLEAPRLPPEERAAYLDRQCEGDPRLRRSAELILARDDSGLGLLQSGGLAEFVASVYSESPQADLPERIGHYRVVRRIGVGGMGEVFLAEDARLKRKIAIKTLPAESAQNPERRARFEREARAIAALNHPNIVTIYSVEEAAGRHFITMELVEGHTLGEVIATGGLPAERVLELALPLTDAVGAAHERGITHRDLKPENVMLNEKGRLKVLDFGLAKLGESSGALASADETLTQVRSVTQEGRIIGTVAYMSPEQAEGRAVDARSDVFSLGTMLYEMATGRRPFGGDSPVAIISSILRETPPSISDLNPSQPADLSEIVRRCVEKDPDRRFESAAELHSAIAGLAAEVAAGTARLAPRPAPAPPRVARRALAAAAVVLTVGVAGYGLLRDRVGGEAARAPTPTFEQLTEAPGVEWLPSLAPDGSFVAYAADAKGASDIFLQRLGERNAVNLTVGYPGRDTEPAVSPDAQSIAFRSDRDGGGLFVMSVDGGAPRRLTDFGYNPGWSPDGQEVVFATEQVVLPFRRVSRSELWAVDVWSGRTRKVAEGDAVQPSCSPSGERIAYWGLENQGAARRGVYTIPALGGPAVEAISSEHTNWSPIWSANGSELLFLSDRGGNMSLWRVSLDEASGERRGGPAPVTTPSRFPVHLTSSIDGRRVVYSSYDWSMHLYRLPFDPEKGAATGLPVQVSGGSRLVVNFDLSPDGREVVFTTGQQIKQEDLFLMASDGTGVRPLTSDVHRDRGPRWSPDGSRIVFYSDRVGETYQIFTIQSNGNEPTQLTRVGPGEVAQVAANGPYWGPRGERVLYHVDDKLLVLDLTEPDPYAARERLPNLDEQGLGDDFITTDWSPDGRFLAGIDSKPDGEIVPGIVLFSFENRRFRRLTDFGKDPAFLRDGRRLLFSDGSGIHLLDIESGESRRILEVPGVITVQAGPDDRTIFFNREITEADLWLMTLDDDPAG